MKVNLTGALYGTMVKNHCSLGFIIRELVVAGSLNKLNSLYHNKQPFYFCIKEVQF